MSDYINKYRNRLNRTGKDVGEAYSNNTISFIEKTFHASPTYRVMDVESNNDNYSHIKTIDGRVVEVERLGSLREIVLRPTGNLEIGMYVFIDGEWYMLIDKYGGTGSTSVKMLAIKVNQSLLWVGRDGLTKDYKCVTSATDLGSKSKQSKNEIEWNKYDVRLPMGQMFISVEKNSETEKIGLNHRFIFGRNVYEVTGIDDLTLVGNDGYGIIQLTSKITTKRDNDDFNSGIAENKYLDNSTSDDKDEGGRLW